MPREELQRLYDQCVSRAFRAEQLAGLVQGVESFLAEPDPTIEIAYLKAKLADLESARVRCWRAGYAAACERYGHELGTYGDKIPASPYESGAES